MTWTILVAGLFYLLGFLLGLEFRRAPPERECEPWGCGCPLWDEPESRYRRVIEEQYGMRVN